jgi:hypothetical protein
MEDQHGARAGRKPSLTLALEQSGPYDPDAMPLREARERLNAYYRAAGRPRAPKLLTAPTAQTKLGKSKRPAYGLSLAAADMSDWEACIWRTPLCTAACVLVTGGRSVFSSIREARALKTNALGAEPQAFITLLAHEIDAAARKHGGIDLRLNVASDLRWERFAPKLLQRPNVRAYDYTKAHASARDRVDGYALTFSVSERPASTREALEWLQSGGNAAVVFERMTRADWDGILPSDWEGFQVIDGDISDSRTDDPAGTVVGLRAKGAAVGTRGAADGFVKPGA